MNATFPRPFHEDNVALPPRSSGHRRLHVAFVDEELPYPSTSGKRIRTLNLVRRLAQRHRLTYLCHRNADPEEAREAERHFAQMGIETIVVERAVPSRSGPGFYARLAANLFSSLPYSVTSHDSRALRSAVRRYHASHSVDLWHCEWTPYAAALRELPQTRRLVMAHNVESQIWQRYFENETNSVKKWYIGHQWRKFRFFETWAVSTADCTVAVSDNDASLLRQQFGGRRVEVVDNGVDTDYFRPPAKLGQPDHLLFLGSLDWRPNLDAVAQLLDSIFPAVQAVQPGARLSIVGRQPPAFLRHRVASMPGVELCADVPDVRPYLARAGMLVVPLRIGGGSRLKILEALAAGLPVVTTQTGAEGLLLEPGHHLTVVPHVNDVAGAILQMIEAPAAAHQQAMRGRCRVLEYYDWNTLASRLEQVWINCVADDEVRAKRDSLRSRSLLAHGADGNI